MKSSVLSVFHIHVVHIVLY